MIKMNDVVKIVSDLIKFPSETPASENKKTRLEQFVACQETLEYIEDILKSNGFKTKQMTFEGDHEKYGYPVPNLYAEISIGNKAAENHKFICYSGHIDVVTPGDRRSWNKNPFSGAIQDGFVHGRGATDMKGSVGAWISAIKNIQKEMPKENITIGTIITGDEEWGAINGTDKVLQWMKNNNKEPDAFLIGEPSSEDYLGTNIKIGRRGSLIGHINVEGIQGHRANDKGFINPDRALSYIKILLNRKLWEDGDELNPDTTLEFIYTDHGKENITSVISEKTLTKWSIRYNNQQTPETIMSHLDNIIKDPPKSLQKLEGFELTKKLLNENKIQLTANYDTASRPYYSEPKELAQSAVKAIKSVIKNIDPEFDCRGGTTDARFVHKYFPNAQIIELGLPERGGIVNNKKKDDYYNAGGMHQINERASEEDLNNLFDIYKNTIKQYSR